MDTKSFKTDKISKKKKWNLRLYNSKWVILITIWTFLLAVGLSLVSEIVLKNTTIALAFIILIIIVFFGIFFDLIGIAVAAAREKPFHSMAANKIKGANYAIKLVKSAGPVSNFCNDVIGDICGIISGAAATIIVIQITRLSNINDTLLSITLSGVVAALTVGGKAIAKEIALRKSKEIVYSVGKTLYYVNKHLRLDFFNDKRARKKDSKRKRDE